VHDQRHDFIFGTHCKDSPPNMMGVLAYRRLSYTEQDGDFSLPQIVSFNQFYREKGAYRRHDGFHRNFAGEFHRLFFTNL
jgi:hypothetical protein